ncbi:MAG: alpha/beta fold hydrolase [Mycobacterium leprae]
MPDIMHNGLKLHYQWQGRYEGPVLVFVNGLLTDLSSWNAHLPYFTEHFHVLTYDCRGQGGSDKPEEGPYTPAIHAEDLAGLLDGLRIQQAAIIGVSSGACIAMQYAVRHPERVSALVLANGYGRADTFMQVKLNSWDSAMGAGGGPLRFDTSTPWIWGRSYLNNHFEGLKPFREKGTALPAHAVHHLIRGGMTHDVLADLPQITCPTLLLTGDEDVLTPLPYAREIQERIPHARMQMLEVAGHCMFLEQYEAFAKASADFLNATVVG